jgi:hypothetical protein
MIQMALLPAHQAYSESRPGLVRGAAQWRHRRRHPAAVVAQREQSSYLQVTLTQPLSFPRFLMIRQDLIIDRDL